MRSRLPDNKAKVHIKIKTDKRNYRKNDKSLFIIIFRWKYMRENLFLCRVYICKSPNKRVEVENTLHLFLLVGN